MGVGSFALPAGVFCAASRAGGGRGLFASAPLAAGAAVLVAAPFGPSPRGVAAPRPGADACARCLRWLAGAAGAAGAAGGAELRFCSSGCASAAEREFVFGGGGGAGRALEAAAARLRGHAAELGAAFPLVALRLASTAVRTGDASLGSLLEPLSFARLPASADGALRDESRMLQEALPSAARGHFGFEWYKGVLARLHVNAFKVQPPNLADLLASTKPSGSAVLPAAAMMQHSCAPNTMLMFPEADATFQFVASTDLAAGDELFISYIDETQGVAARQEELRRGYGFDCRCEACVEELGGGAR